MCGGGGGNAGDDSKGTGGVDMVDGMGGRVQMGKGREEGGSNIERGFQDEVHGMGGPGGQRGMQHATWHRCVHSGDTCVCVGGGGSAIGQAEIGRWEQGRTGFEF